MTTDRAERSGEVVLSEPVTPTRAHDPVRSARVYAQVFALTTAVLIVVAGVGAVAARSEARAESTRAAERRTDLLASVVIVPALRDAIVRRGPAAEKVLDAAVREHVLGPAVVRVKLYDADGTLLYSDRDDLVGQRFELDDAAKAVLAGRLVEPVVADTDLPENATERGEGKLLETTRRVRTPSGQPLLFEAFAPYDVVSDRAGALWRSFTAITLLSLLALLLLMLPVLWRLLRRLREQQEQRERLLQSALDASDAERRRIAATLHDGVVQELAATSYAVAGAAGQAARAGDLPLATSLEEAGTAVRAGIGGLRSLLADLYPAGLAEERLVPALEDLLAALRRGPGEDTETGLDADPAAAELLSPAQSQLAFRVAQETLRNATQHACASRVDVTLRCGRRDEGRSVVLEVADDGVGFDVEEVLRRPARGHFGVRLLLDAARDSGAGLTLLTSPGGQGTRWRLVMPLP